MENVDAHSEYTQAYVGILNTYKDQIKDSINKKNDLKDKFFRVIRVVMIVLMILFVVSIIISFIVFYVMIKEQYQSVAVITGAITAMLSSFATMIISLYKLPQIIADYLFNKEEDNLMNEIIKNIQQYEIDAVKLEKMASINAGKEKLSGQKSDFPMKNSPNTTGKQPESSDEHDVDVQAESKVSSNQQK